MSVASWLPDRYHVPWDRRFRERIRGTFRPGMTILDLGSGRRPTIPIEDRPPDCRYIGLDISREELERAGRGAYDEIWVADATELVPELVDRVDLVVSWLVLEHVKPLDGAIENVRRYLRPGGSFVAQFSGTFAFFALVNMIIPHRLAAFLVTRLLGRAKGGVFPAHYHHCWYSALRRIFRPWRRAEIDPLYLGANYLRFLPILGRIYLVYEDWAVRTRQRDLGTYYFVHGVK